MYLKLAACLESVGFRQDIMGFGPHFWIASDTWHAHIVPGIVYKYFTLYHPIGTKLLSFEFTDDGIVHADVIPTVNSLEGLVFLNMFMLAIPELQTPWLREFITQQANLMNLSL